MNDTGPGLHALTDTQLQEQLEHSRAHWDLARTAASEAFAHYLPQAQETLRRKLQTAYPTAAYARFAPMEFDNGPFLVFAGVYGLQGQLLAEELTEVLDYDAQQAFEADLTEMYGALADYELPVAAPPSAASSPSPQVVGMGGGVTSKAVEEAFGRASEEIAAVCANVGDVLAAITSEIVQVVEAQAQTAGQDLSSETINRLACEVMDEYMAEHDVPDTGLRDAINLLLNAGMSYIDTPHLQFEDVAGLCYSEELTTILDWINNG